jgi:hypothetical protein
MEIVTASVTIYETFSTLLPTLLVLFMFVINGFNGSTTQKVLDQKAKTLVEMLGKHIYTKSTDPTDFLELCQENVLFKNENVSKEYINTTCLQVWNRIVTPDFITKFRKVLTYFTNFFTRRQFAGTSSTFENETFQNQNDTFQNQNDTPKANIFAGLFPIVTEEPVLNKYFVLFMISTIMILFPKFYENRDNIFSFFSGAKNVSRQYINSFLFQMSRTLRPKIQDQVEKVVKIEQNEQLLLKDKEEQPQMLLPIPVQQAQEPSITPVPVPQVPFPIAVPPSITPVSVPQVPFPIAVPPPSPSVPQSSPPKQPSAPLIPPPKSELLVPMQPLGVPLYSKRRSLVTKRRLSLLRRRSSRSKRKSKKAKSKSKKSKNAKSKSKKSKKAKSKSKRKSKKLN